MLLIVLLILLIVLLILVIPGVLHYGYWPGPARPAYVAPAGTLLTVVLVVVLVWLLLGVW
jgi:hypothetical protein